MAVSWSELVVGVRRAFSTDCVDVNEVKRLMSSYESNRSDWIAYEKYDPHRYTRNLVDEGNGRYNLIVLCWDTAQGSSIHSHADSHCFMKVLRGTLQETLFAWPEEDKKTGSGSENLAPMTVTKAMTHNQDAVTYINDSIGLHRVENPSHADPAVSLHLYCPPIRVCQTFEERTGRSHKCTVTFYTTPESCTEKDSETEVAACCN